MGKLVPDLCSMETAVDNIVYFFFCPHDSVKHYLRVGDIMVSSGAMKHALSTLMEGIKLNPETTCIFPCFFALGDYLESDVVVVQTKVIVAFALLVYLLGDMQL